MLIRAPRSRLTQSGFSSRHIEVSAQTIDNYNFDKIGVVKMDIEGHQYAALKGARQTIIRCKPAIVDCEERHNPGAVQRVFTYFQQLNYQSFFLHRGLLRPGAEFRPTELRIVDKSKQFGTPRSPDYINSFIFVHETKNNVHSRI